MPQVVTLIAAGGRKPTAEAQVRALLLRVVLLGLLLRVAGIFITHSYRVIFPNFESAQIAAALVAGKGFSNPFGADTGPTAWLPPVYPWILAAIFRVFGAMTRASAFAALGLNCVFSVLTTIPLFFIAERSFGPKVARWSAWLWAVLPYPMYWGVKWVWDTALSALLLALAFLLTQWLATRPAARVGAVNLGRFLPPVPLREPRVWVLYGLLWGGNALTNTAALAFLPFAGLWIIARRLRAGGSRGLFTNTALGAVVFLASIAPWTLRNYVVFHRFVPIRGNFWMEFHLGNTLDAMGDRQPFLHPTGNHWEFQRFVALGEPAYLESKKQEALRFVHEHPRHFAFLTLAHLVYFWDGVPYPDRFPGEWVIKSSAFLITSLLASLGAWTAWRQCRPGAGLFAALLFSYPLVYYFTFPHARYRAPMEPEMLILAVYAIWMTQKQEFSPEPLPRHSRGQ